MGVDLMHIITHKIGRKLFLCVFAQMFAVFATALICSAQSTNFGVNLSGGKEPVELSANALEMRDKDGVAIFTGNVSVIQGERVLRTSKLIVYYDKNNHSGSKNEASVGGLGSTGVEKMQASGKVYIKTATQVATGDEGTFNGKTKIMTLTGNKVILTDGNNVASGCKLVAHMDTGKAYMQSCRGNGSGRVSIIMDNQDTDKK